MINYVASWHLNVLVLFRGSLTFTLAYFVDYIYQIDQKSKLGQYIISLKFWCHEKAYFEANNKCKLQMTKIQNDKWPAIYIVSPEGPYLFVRWHHHHKLVFLAEISLKIFRGCWSQLVHGGASPSAVPSSWLTCPTPFVGTLQLAHHRYSDQSAIQHYHHRHRCLDSGLHVKIHNSVMHRITYIPFVPQLLSSLLQWSPGESPLVPSLQQREAAVGTKHLFKSTTLSLCFF